MELRARNAFRASERLTLGATYPLSKTYGTFVAENQSVGAIPSEAQPYPEYFDAFSAGFRF